jgi:hypothetical protein
VCWANLLLHGSLTAEHADSAKPRRERHALAILEDLSNESSTFSATAETGPCTSTVGTQRAERSMLAKRCWAVTSGVSSRVGATGVRRTLYDRQAGVHVACRTTGTHESHGAKPVDLLRELARRSEDDDRRLGDARALRRATAVAHQDDGLDAREQVRARLARTRLHRPPPVKALARAEQPEGPRRAPISWQDVSGRRSQRHLGASHQVATSEGDRQSVLLDRRGSSEFATCDVRLHWRGKVEPSAAASGGQGVHGMGQSEG